MEENNPLRPDKARKLVFDVGMVTPYKHESTAKVRRLIFRAKTPEGADDAWRPPPVPPRLLPFARTLKLTSDWRWRMIECAVGEERFALFGRVNVRKGNYQAWLLHKEGVEVRLLARLEDHGNHAGLHIHAHCGEELPETGTGSINAPVRRPGSRFRSRRTVQGATLDTFWATARDMFRIHRQPRFSAQSELSL